jgi:dimethylamine/trimethylamine dehydrogenase
LFHELAEKVDGKMDSAPKSITRIGDCEAPAIIAGAVFSGHRYARELDTVVDPDRRLKFDRVFFEDD